MQAAPLRHPSFRVLQLGALVALAVVLAQGLLFLTWLIEDRRWKIAGVGLESEDRWVLS